MGRLNLKSESKLPVLVFFMKQEAASNPQNRYGFQQFKETAEGKNFS